MKIVNVKQEEITFEQDTEKEKMHQSTHTAIECASINFHMIITHIFSAFCVDFSFQGYLKIVCLARYNHTNIHNNFPRLYVFLSNSLE